MNHPNQAYIGDDDGADDCQVSNLLALNANHGLQACGTTMEYNAADDQVEFKVFFSSRRRSGFETHRIE